MAYSASRHGDFHAHCAHLMQGIQNLRNSASELDDVYTQEAQSGAHADFGDYGDTTEAQLAAVITFWRDLEKFCTNQAVTTADREANIAPFLVTGPP